MLILVILSVHNQDKQNTYWVVTMQGGSFFCITLQLFVQCHALTWHKVIIMPNFLLH